MRHLHLLIGFFFLLLLPAGVMAQESSLISSHSTAVSDQTLLPLADLCHTFPTDAQQTILAYAESDAFMRYLQATYGDEVVGRLIAAYGDGADCDSGIKRALGVSLAEAEADWLHASEPQSPLATAWKESRLWLLLLAGGGLLSLLLTRK